MFQIICIAIGRLYGFRNANLNYTVLLANKIEHHSSDWLNFTTLYVPTYRLIAGTATLVDCYPSSSAFRDWERAELVVDTVYEMLR